MRRSIVDPLGQDRLDFEVGGAKMPHVEALAGKIDVYVSSDGSVKQLDPTRSLLGPQQVDAAPEVLVHFAVGLLSGSESEVQFIWTDDQAAPYWNVHLRRVQVGQRDVAHLQADRSTALPHGLTRRELDIVTLVSAGMANPTIASALQLSRRTVTTHVERVMRKMEATSRWGVAAIAHDSGIAAVPLPIDADELPMLRVARMLSKSGGKRSARTALRTTPAPGSPIVVGALVPLTGHAREDGAEMVQGAELAIEEINAQGGAYGRPLLLEVADVDVNSRSEVASAMMRLLSSGASAITSGYLAHQDHAVEIAATDGIPFLHASASAVIDDLVAGNPQRFRGVFQVCPNDRNYATNYVMFMSELRNSGQWVPRSNQLVVAVQNKWDIVDFGLSAAAALATEQGWDLIPLAVLDREGAEGAWATAAARLGPAAAVMLGSFFVDDHVQFLETFLAQPSDALVYSIYAPSIPSFRQRLGRAADGVMWATTTGTYSDAVAHDFVSSFKARFGRPPGRSMAGIAYDRVNILAHAWAQAEDAGDFDAVANRLTRTRYRGVNGAYHFRGHGNGTLALGTQSSDPSLSQAHTIFQIRQGRNVLIGPNLYATGHFAMPAWTSGAGTASQAQRA